MSHCETGNIYVDLRSKCTFEGVIVLYMSNLDCLTSISQAPAAVVAERVQCGKQWSFRSLNWIEWIERNSSPVVLACQHGILVSQRGRSFRALRRILYGLDCSWNPLAQQCTFHERYRLERCIAHWSTDIALLTLWLGWKYLGWSQVALQKGYYLMHPVLFFVYSQISACLTAADHPYQGH